MTNQLLFGVNYFNQTFNDANHSFDTKASYGLILSPDATDQGPADSGRPEYRRSRDLNRSASRRRKAATTSPACWPTSSPTTSASISSGSAANFARATWTNSISVTALGKFVFDGTPGVRWAAYCGTMRAQRQLDARMSGCNQTRRSLPLPISWLEIFVEFQSLLATPREKSWSTDSISLARTHGRSPADSTSTGDCAGTISVRSTTTARTSLCLFPTSGIKIQGNGIDSIFPGDKNNFAPRFGFAYQPTKTGRSGRPRRNRCLLRPDQHEPVPRFPSAKQCGWSGGQSRWPVSGFHLQPGRTTGTLAANGVSAVPRRRDLRHGDAQHRPDCGYFRVRRLRVNQNFRTPYFFNYNLNVQKSFGQWHGRMAGRLRGQRGPQAVDHAEHQPARRGPDGNDSLTAFPNYGAINQLNSIGTSNYNALQTTLRLRAWHGLSPQFAYTWAHALDLITAYRGVIPFDSNNLKAEYGNGDFDTRHNFSATLTWDIPGSSHGPKILTHGWSVNSLMTFHGGQPIGPEVRPGYDIIGDPFAGVSHSFPADTGVTWINPAAFCINDVTAARDPDLPGWRIRHFRWQPAPEQNYGPGYSSVDLSVLKNIPITERVRAQFRVEMFQLIQPNQPRHRLRCHRSWRRHDHRHHRRLQRSPWHRPRRSLQHAAGPEDLF